MQGKLKREKAEAASVAKETKKDLESLKNTFKSMAAEFDRKKRNEDRLARELDEKLADLQHTQEQLLSREDSVAFLRQENQALPVERDACKHQLALAQKDAAVADSELGSSRRQVAALRKGIERMHWVEESDDSENDSDDDHVRPRDDTATSAGRNDEKRASRPERTPSMKYRSAPASRSSSRPGIHHRESYPYLSQRYHPYAQGQITPSTSSGVVPSISNPPDGLRHSQSAREMRDMSKEQATGAKRPRTGHKDGNVRVPCVLVFRDFPVLMAPLFNRQAKTVAPDPAEDQGGN